jgi:hypothetical protein
MNGVLVWGEHAVKELRRLRELRNRKDPNARS